MCKIGIFDSGIGGISFLKKALKCLPEFDFLYFEDIDNVPYGIKTKEEVQAFADQAVKFLMCKQVDLLVLACNAATSAAAAHLRKNYPIPILGMEPAIKPALEYAGLEKVLLLSTSLTLNENKLNDLLHRVDDKKRVKKIALDDLVDFAENFDFDSSLARQLLEEKFLNLDLRKFRAIVLGCTHFIYYKPLIQSMTPESIQFFDGNQGTLNNLIFKLRSMCIQRSILRRGSLEFYSSGRKTPQSRKEQLLKLVS